MTPGLTLDEEEAYTVVHRGREMAANGKGYLLARAAERRREAVVLILSLLAMNEPDHDRLQR
ncbi:unnamed protein product [Urochloa humidicola]